MIRLWAGDNTHYIELSELKLQPSGDYVNDATVEAYLLKDGEDVTGAGNPISLSADANTDGRYEGTIPADAEINANERYEIRVVADNGTEKAEWEESVNARDRTMS